MTRGIITLLILLVLLLSIGFFSAAMVNHTSTRLSELSTSMLDIPPGPTAADELAALNALWERYRQLWHIFMDHRDLQEVGLQLTQAREALEEQNEDDWRKALLALVFLFNDVPNQERLEWENVL